MYPTDYSSAQARADADRRTLGRAFLRHVRRRPWVVAVQDAGGTLSRARLAGVALALEPLLELAGDEEVVGVLLPPGRGGSAVNVSLALAGRVALNLNHTLGEAALARILERAGVRTVVSARPYLERIGEPALPARVLHAEELIPRLSKAAVVAGIARTLLLPSGADRARPAGVALLIYSSGSTGEPKGVLLTHRQVLALCDQAVATLDLRAEQDVVLTALPLFHSFGVIVGNWLPLVHGMGIAAQADPLDATSLGRLAARTRPTFLISTPTFLRTYMRRVTPDQFRSLRFAVVGAERSTPELHESFRQRYGVEILEGYGATEVAGGLSVNAPDAMRHGSVGRPLPGVELFTVHPETLERLPAGEEGVLVARTPARMVGYLGDEARTRAAFLHGGYNTGDIGRLDADGFVHLTGRLARFAKIGGEMVPLDNVEAALQSHLDQTYGDGYEVAVVAVRDERRGERLLVLHTGLPCAPDELLDALADFPPLFRPRPADVHAVEELPVLGTGKRDIGGLQRLGDVVGLGTPPDDETAGENG
jgi:acyl-[acyl-carrier-protein]-phospholipid O-acyltransferase/long-chain-fatty-acid--[acyl-carrier-protein] ligase